MPDTGGHAVINALNVYLVDPVEIRFRSVFKFSDVRNAGAVHQDVNRLLAYDPVKYPAYALPISHVAKMSRCCATSIGNRSGDCFALLVVQIDDMDICPARRKQ